MIEQTQTAKHFQLSPSKIAAFVTCPTMFKARYLLGIKPPPSPSMVLGSAVHKALEFLGRRRQLDMTVTQDELLVEFNEAFKAQIEEDGVEISAEEQSKLSSAGGSLVRLYLERFGHEKPIASELHLDEPLIHPTSRKEYQRPKLKDVEPGPLNLYGIVDSLISEPDGLVVVDFKTTSRTSADSSVMLSHRIQLLAYAYLIEQASDKKLKAVEIRQLVRKKEPEIVVTRVPLPTPHSYGALFLAIDQLLLSLESDAFLARYGWHCHATCEGYGLCSPLS